MASTGKEYVNGKQYGHARNLGEEFVLEGMGILGVILDIRIFISLSNIVLQLGFVLKANWLEYNVTKLCALKGILDGNKWYDFIYCL